MSFKLFRISLILTYSCNAECRHCFFECGPDRKEVMSLELGKKAIDEAANLNAKWISLTGGEPFLQRDLLFDLLEYTDLNGLNSEIVTNCYWAETQKTAEKILSQLKLKGLDVINISLDDFHQEFIPIKKVVNAYNAALNLGLKIVIMITVAKDSEIEGNIIQTLLNDTKIQKIGTPLIQKPNALLIESPVTPAGRGANITVTNLTTVNMIKCSEVIRDIGVGPNGDIYPCCGPLASKLNLGNLNKNSLENLLESSLEIPLINKIRNGTNLMEFYASKCHACLSLVKK